jgi:tRNA(Ile)-lysidine synthase
MNLLHTFQESFVSHGLFSSKDRLLLAVSGGIDSVVLCELCHRSGLDFMLAHANFQLRGEESDKDEIFVRALGKKYGKETAVKKFDTHTYSTDKKVSIQVAARELRYSWFYELTTPQESGIKTVQAPPVYILTAHHMDDNIETILMNFFKGSGIAGLRGMLPKQDKIVRPLLFAAKEDLQYFALTEGLQWAEDSSNQSDRYSRNYFRHEVIPLIRKIYPEAISNLSGNIARFRDIEILYREAVDIHKKKLIEIRGDEIHIPVLKLKKIAPLSSIIFEIIKPFNFTSLQAEQAVSLLDSETGKYIQSATHRVIKNRAWLIIAPNQPVNPGIILIESDQLEVDYPGGRLQFSKLSVEAGQNLDMAGEENKCFLDAEKIIYPLILRRWSKGDYFYPLGIRKKKKIARFLIDNKLSKTEKEKIWVMETDKKIIWVLGLRIDDRFKVLHSTKRVLKIEMWVA